MTDITQHVEKTLLKYYAPACAVINEKNEVVYIHGKTGKYLEPASGKANLNILEMARPGLNIKLSSAIRKAIAQQEEVVYYNLPVKSNGGFKNINLRVKTFTDFEYISKLILVIFEDVNISQKTIKKASHNTVGQYEAQVAELEQELKYTKENLQTTIEELETSNEELKSSNEELQSTNEELQSTNEEIETSKEELQSLNEELTTVNIELQHRIDQLSNANDDMMNLLDSTEIATIFLDNDLCIKRFTPKVTEIINLIPADIGRPVNHIVSNLKYEHLIKDAQEVLKTLICKAIEVESKDGIWYIIRIIPYRTLTNSIDGVVVTFLNIHRQKQAEEALSKLNTDFQQIIKQYNIFMQVVDEPLLLVDADFKITATNAAFHKFFNITDRVLERSLVELVKNNYGIPNLSEFLNKNFQQDALTSNNSIENTFKDISNRTLQVKACSIIPHEYTSPLILVSFKEAIKLDGYGKK